MDAWFVIMSDKVPPKSPYINYTEEEIMATESGHYVIQVGSDFFSYNGKMAFSKERAEHFYDTVIAGLVDMRINGTEAEFADATACLLNLRIMPLRIH